MIMPSPKKIILAGLWIALILYAVFFAPDEKVAGLDDIIDIVSMADHIDPLIFAVFNLLGVWPVIMGAILLIDARDQKIPAWPFVLGSCALGNFILFPYLILRKENPDFQQGTNWLVKICDSKILAAVIFAGTCYLMYIGLFTGSLDTFVAEFKINKLVSVMSVDFLLFMVAFPTVLPDDMRRRGMAVDYQFWLYTVIPVLGPATYLLKRAKLEE